MEHTIKHMASIHDLDDHGRRFEEHHWLVYKEGRTFEVRVKSRSDFFDIYSPDVFKILEIFILEFAVDKIIKK